MIGAARALAAEKGSWHGTVMLIGQPSEETVDGAKAMLADRLYERFGTPDMAGRHCTTPTPVPPGTVACDQRCRRRPTFDFRRRHHPRYRRPRRGSAARPKTRSSWPPSSSCSCKPSSAARNRRSIPQWSQSADIHGGTKRNIIPNEVKLELTTRAFSDHARQVILDGIRHTAQGVAVSAGVPDNLFPIVTVLDDESTPVMYNNPALTVRVKEALVQALGQKNVFDEPPIMGSEDFGVFGLPDHKIPTVMFRLGAMEPAKFVAAEAAGTVLPGPHNSHFQPDPEPTLRTGVIAMTTIAISLLQK